MNASRRFVLFHLIPLVFALGCGDEEIRPPLQPATGSLTINGKPADGAMLVLHPADGVDFDVRGTRPKATVQPDGRFDVTTYLQGDGAPVGDYNVAVLWFADPDANNAWDKLGGRYANPNQTDIRISITEGENQLAPLEIQGARVISRRPQSNSPDRDQVE